MMSSEEVPPIVLLCECGVVNHPDVNRPEIWVTPELVARLTKDHPVTQVGECPTCGYTAYIMKKCVCDNEWLKDRSRLISVLYEAIGSVCDAHGMKLTELMEANLSPESFVVWDAIGAKDNE